MMRRPADQNYGTDRHARLVGEQCVLEVADQQIDRRPDQEWNVDPLETRECVRHKTAIRISAHALERHQDRRGEEEWNRKCAERAEWLELLGFRRVLPDDRNGGKKSGSIQADE